MEISMGFTLDELVLTAHSVSLDAEDDPYVLYLQNYLEPHAWNDTEELLERITERYKLRKSEIANKLCSVKESCLYSQRDNSLMAAAAGSAIFSLGILAQLSSLPTAARIAGGIAALCSAFPTYASYNLFKHFTEQLDRKLDYLRSGVLTTLFAMPQDVGSILMDNKQDIQKALHQYWNRNLPDPNSL
jgi:hypothetical protein